MVCEYCKYIIYRQILYATQRCGSFRAENCQLCHARKTTPNFSGCFLLIFHKIYTSISTFCLRNLRPLRIIYILLRAFGSLSLFIYIYISYYIHVKENYLIRSSRYFRYYCTSKPETISTCQQYKLKYYYLLLFILKLIYE